MPLSIKNPEVERLVDEVARLAGESKTEAVRRALQERRDRLVYRQAGDDRELRLRQFLVREAWPSVPDQLRGRTLTRAQQDELLGHGKDSV